MGPKPLSAKRPHALRGDRPQQVEPYLAEVRPLREDLLNGRGEELDEQQQLLQATLVSARGPRLLPPADAGPGRRGVRGGQAGLAGADERGQAPGRRPVQPAGARPLLPRATAYSARMPPRGQPLARHARRAERPGRPGRQHPAASPRHARSHAGSPVASRPPGLLTPFRPGCAPARGRAARAPGGGPRAGAGGGGGWLGGAGGRREAGGRGGGARCCRAAAAAAQHRAPPGARAGTGCPPELLQACLGSGVKAGGGGAGRAAHGSEGDMGARQRAGLPALCLWPTPAPTSPAVRRRRGACMGLSPKASLGIGL